MRNRTLDLVKRRHPAGQIELKPKTTTKAPLPWTVRLMARVTKSASEDDEVEGLAKQISGNRNSETPTTKAPLPWTVRLMARVTKSATFQKFRKDLPSSGDFSRMMCKRRLEPKKCPAT
ncbi:hypothetical protein T265_02355 [Opisthorchis viverrini]|uniref:Uncharacterized protein n=1 Tax=Opisthorchis viverrini TaxID=6198 RepID=A0A074ZZK0_OPIVI|nr:hypothetical protein T265_02355 [Opisthorchis viverrini]KER31447.1 hypothetical protein T265_02355 [Opisthorchis viverrini]